MRNPHDVTTILSIPIGQGNSGDSLIWHHTANGTYSVRSGYHTYMEAQRQFNPIGQTATHAPNRRFWTQLWSIPTLPKVRIFIWRAVKDILPTNKSLHRRISSIDPNCRLCGNSEEDGFHSLFGCLTAREVWERTFPILGNWHIRTVESILHWAFDVLDSEALCYFSLLCWFIWKNRCTTIFDGKATTAQNIISNAGSLAADVLSMLESQPTSQHQSINLSSTWRPPDTSTLSLNVDAGFGEDGERACGVLVRDNSGNILHAASSFLPQGIDVLHGELLAILRGLEFAHECGYPRIEVWSDCLTAIRMLEENEEHLHPLAAIVGDCLYRKMAFSSCSFYFVRRNHNYPAHLLARWSILHKMSMSWGPNPPPYVLDAALADLL